jgi:hypothetical protein
VSAVRDNHLWSYDIIGTAAADGHPAFNEYWTGGAMERAADTYQWYLDNEKALLQALR